MAIFLGLDPGSNTGLATWDSEKHQLTNCCTIPLWRALEVVSDFSITYGDKLRVIFEDARKRKWFQKETSQSEYRGKLMGAGSVKRDCVIWEEFLTAKGIPFQAVAPAAGKTKWSEEYFSLVTGWKGRTSEHARDAALLVFGKYERQ